jgi:membrane protein involved in colicin uptake
VQDIVVFGDHFSPFEFEAKALNAFKLLPLVKNKHKFDQWLQTLAEVEKAAVEKAAAEQAAAEKAAAEKAAAEKAAAEKAAVEAEAEAVALAAIESNLPAAASSSSAPLSSTHPPEAEAAGTGTGVSGGTQPLAEAVDSSAEAILEVTASPVSQDGQDGTSTAAVVSAQVKPGDR